MAKLFIRIVKYCYLFEGTEEAFEKRSKRIYDVCSEFGPTPEFSGRANKLIIDSLTQRIPIECLSQRRKWRDERLIALSQLKKKLE